jgi:hypothetical protein
MYDYYGIGPLSEMEHPTRRALPPWQNRQNVEARQCMTLNEIESTDKELLAARYEVAVMEEFRALATGWFERPLDELIAKSRADGKVLIQGSRFSMNTEEIVTEYDYEMNLLSQIRREGGKALTRSYANLPTENSLGISVLNLDETLAAMVKHRYSSQSLVNGFWADVWP